MEIINTPIDGLQVIAPAVFRDARGYFCETFRESWLPETHFVQDNESCSSYGVMRGLHFQRPPFTQAKLVRCMQGAVLDVAVDIRVGSPTFGKHHSVLLCGPDMLSDDAPAVVGFTREEVQAAAHRQFFIGHGFAHGFSVLSPRAIFCYKCDNTYHPEADGGICITDPSLGIDWHLDPSTALLSEKDTKHACLADFDSPFRY